MAEFDPQARYLVQSIVERYRGRAYRKGAEFPSNSPEHVRAHMLRQGRIRLAEQASTEKTDHAPGAEATPPASAPEAPAEEPTVAPAAPAWPGPYTAQHRGRGSWAVVDSAGNVVEDKMDRSTADAIAAQRNSQG